jgi:hypothetical protein
MAQKSGVRCEVIDDENGVISTYLISLRTYGNYTMVYFICQWVKDKHIKWVTIGLEFLT